MDRRFASVDYYEALGLASGAGDADVRSAFRRLALVHHPDKASYDKEQAKIRFQEIAEAYEVLSDPGLREHYLHVRRREDDTQAQVVRASTDGTGSAQGRGARAQARRAAKDKFSLSAMRSASMEAELQEERQQREKSRNDSLAAEREEQARYDSLKGSLKTKLSRELQLRGGEVGDADWGGWFSKQVKCKWLNSYWETHLPEAATSGNLQEMVLHEVRQDLERERAARQTGGGYACTGVEASALPVREVSHAGAAPKRRSQRPAVPSAQPMATPTVVLPPRAQEYLDRCDSGSQSRSSDYLELFTALSDLGFSTNDAELAARRETSVAEAIRWLATKA